MARKRSPGGLCDGCDGSIFWGMDNTAPALTAAQLATIAEFQNLARETGATVEVVREDDGYTTIIETLSAEWDNAQTMWTLYSDGTADIR